LESVSTWHTNIFKQKSSTTTFLTHAVWQNDGPVLFWKGRCPVLEYIWYMIHVAWSSWVATTSIKCDKRIYILKLVFEIGIIFVFVAVVIYENTIFITIFIIHIIITWNVQIFIMHIIITWNVIWWKIYPQKSQTT